MALDFASLRGILQNIYQKYESGVAQFKEQAVCHRGCSSCCSVVGAIDIVTVEGIILREALDAMPDSESREVCQGIERDITLRRNGKMSACPFLDERGACRVYQERPFSCRQLYSLRKCDQDGPLVHKQAVALSRKAVRDIQKLDDTGYSGHHSYILKLLQNDKFRHTYSAGGFDPGSIKKYGRKHGIIINRFAK